MVDRGILTISIDVELAWGVCDRSLTPPMREAIAKERQAIRAVLSLFDRYSIRATWAVVAHLLLEECGWDGELPHPEIPRPVQMKEERDWFFQHPTENSDLWYGRDIVEQIACATPTQEIGSHSFGHLIYDEGATTRTAVEADLSLARELHDSWPLPFSSFVYPKNVVGYRKALADTGIRAYRGKTRRVYGSLLHPVLRAAHLAEHIVPLCPPTVTPVVDEFGLVNIPDSMLLIGRNGLRRLVSSRSLIRKGTRGVAAASERGEVFHLWFHPSNFVHKATEQLDVLEAILHKAASLRDVDRLEVLTMDDLADRFRGS